MLFKGKFNWIHHIIVTVILLTIVDLLVIYIPTIKDVFAVIGRLQYYSRTNIWLYGIYNIFLHTIFFSVTPFNFYYAQISNTSHFFVPGSTAANMLIFILPASLYLKLVKNESQGKWTKINVGTFNNAFNQFY